MIHRILDIAVIGAGPTGLTAALLLARDGHRVLVCEGDAGPSESAQGSTTWQRPGVSQFRMAHVLLPRWRHELEAELSDLVPALVSAGAAPYNLLHQQPASVTGGRDPGDEVFDTLAARRPVLEAVLRELAAAEPSIELREGCPVDGLAMSADRSAMTGLMVGASELAADLVIDAAGARSPVRRSLADVTGRPVVRPPVENRLTYFGRWFEAPTAPPRLGPLLVNHPSWSLLTLPSDGGAYAVVLVVGPRDRPARDLHDPERWTAAVRCDPVGAAWLEHGRPIGDVEVHGGFDRVPTGDDVRIAGLVSVGDAAAVTNPLLGRGLSIGAIGAITLRDVLRGGFRDRTELHEAHRVAHGARVAGWMGNTAWLVRNRAAEMHAQAEGRPYRPDDPAWAMATALRAGAGHDPVLARAQARLASLLATPAEVFGDAEVSVRARRFIGAPPAPEAPDRADLLAAIAGTPPTSPTGEEPSTTQGVHHVRISV